MRHTFPLFGSPAVSERPKALRARLTAGLPLSQYRSVGYGDCPYRSVGRVNGHIAYRHILCSFVGNCKHLSHLSVARAT